LRGGKGFLKPLDRDALFIHYPFETNEQTPFGSDRSRRTTIRNHGELDGTYDARTWNTTPTRGRLGQGLHLKEEGVVDVHGTGPFGLFDRSERTLSIWLKTTSDGKHNIICGGSGLKAKHPGRTDQMDLGIQKGRLFVRTSAGEIPVKHTSISDGEWHHVALVVMPNARRVGNLRVYVDGRRQPWAGGVDESQSVVTVMGIYGISLGGSHRPVWAKSKREPGIASLAGTIDDFAAWYRALSPDEIEHLFKLGDSQGLNASQVDERLRRSR
jgi:Concanavalin A-like lectin/glucanases superfamily